MVFLEFLFNHFVQIFKKSFQSSTSSSWNKDLLLHVNPYKRHYRMYIQTLPVTEKERCEREKEAPDLGLNMDMQTIVERVSEKHKNFIA